MMSVPPASAGGFIGQAAQRRFGPPADAGGTDSAKKNRNQTDHYRNRVQPAISSIAASYTCCWVKGDDFGTLNE